MSKNWKNYRQQRADETDDGLKDLINQAIREDIMLEAEERAKIGRPRIVPLDGFGKPFVRITQPDHLNHGHRRGGDDRKDRMAVASVIERLSEIKTLGGPATVHAVDEMVAALFEEAANFGPALEAIRRCSQVHIRQGARWLQFRPLVIESSPGAGKTRLVHLLAQHSGLPMAYLDCAAMTNLNPIISQDGGWSTSRHSDVMEALANSGEANIIICLDELDKLRDLSRNSAPLPSEGLVGLLEKRSAAVHMDNYLQLAVDLSFVNWVILVNSVDRLSKPFLDRCQVIRLPAPTVDEIAVIAAREIERRGLEVELIAPITKAVKDGKITSMRQLHRLLDRAASASARPRLN